MGKKKNKRGNNRDERASFIVDMFREFPDNKFSLKHLAAASGGADRDSFDPMCIEALRHVILRGSASISMIQRKCSVGYNKAGKIVEWMEDMGYISAFDGAKARKVLITKEEFESKYGPL